MNRMIRLILASMTMSAGIALGALPASGQDVADKVQPEAATGVTIREPVTAKSYMISAANPHAVRAGVSVLEKGGSAADAAVAVQAMLGLVEPQSSGLGGGAFLLHYDAATGKVTTVDGRETAPKSANGNLFMGPDGKPLGFFEAVVGGRSVGVPGVVRLLEKVHDEHGKLPWNALFDDAIKLATDGFEISQRLGSLIAFDLPRLSTHAETSAYFLTENGEAKTPGTILRNPAYAETLTTLKLAGPDEFYTGAAADRIVDAVRLHETNPGDLTHEDIAAYEAKDRPAVCTPYREYEVCGMGPPSSGGLTVGQILQMVSHFDLATLGPDDPQSWRIIGEASRLSFADRGRYMADSDFVKVPRGLLNPGYLESRSNQIRRDTALGKDEVSAGEPPWDKAELRLDGLELEQPSTSHFSIIDTEGNVVSVTSSVENVFGSRMMAGGFILNNQLTDFSFLPEQDGKAVANRVEGGKRPRSSMSPTIVLKDGKPAFVIGSPGGSRIIPYVAKTIIALIDWDMNMQQAVDLPHLVNRFGTYDLEKGTKAEAMQADLEALGYETSIRDLNSGLHGIAVLNDGTLEGGADSRREGLAAGR